MVNAAGSAAGDWTEGISATAVLTAKMRALEHESENPLVTDLAAAHLVAASGLEMGAVSLSEMTGQRLFESNVVRTWWLDEQIGSVLYSAVQPRQVVILAAGLDSRVTRLSFPAGTTVFEIDLPQISMFKSTVFAEEPSIELAATWRQVTASITEPGWSDQLVKAGFDRAEPTIWVAEGILFYLSDAETSSVLSTVSGLSASGSTLLVAHFGPGSRSDAQTREMNSTATQSGYGFQSVVEDPASGLGDYGWTTDATTIARVAESLGRSIDYGEPERAGAEVTWLIRADR